MNSLKAFRGLSHRMERLGERNGIAFINNSMCTNPSAVIASSRAIPGRQRLLIGGVTKGLDFSELGEYLKGTSHAAYLFGRDAKAIGAQLGGAFPIFETMDQALESALADAQPGDSVVLSPGAASLDQFEDFRARGDAFKKRAMEWLKA
jgi:UDP-N-acetylmuramoylalanine--D-glutamate ligase